MTATIQSAIGAAVKTLQAAGIGDARLDARLLLTHAIDVAPSVPLAYPERTLSAAQEADFDAYIARRAKRERPE